MPACDSARANSYVVHVLLTLPDDSVVSRDKIHTPWNSDYQVRLLKRCFRSSTNFPFEFYYLSAEKTKQEMQADVRHNNFKTQVTAFTLSRSKWRRWVKVSPAISLCTFELLQNESLIRKAITLHWHSGNSSLRMPIHIKLYKQPTHTSRSNKWQTKSRYN